MLERYGIYIYIRFPMSVDALDEAGALTFGSKENFWEVTILYIIKGLPLLFMSVLPR